MPTEEDANPGDDMVSDVVPPLTPRTLAVVSVWPAGIVIVAGVTTAIADAALVNDRT